MPETPDEARYGAPAAGDSPSFARAARNSARKRSGTAGRLAVHHAWIARTCRRASGETSTRYRFNARDGGVEAGERQARRAPSSHSSPGRRGTGPPNAAAPREDGPGLRRQGLRPCLPGRAQPPSLPAGRRARRAGAVRPAPEPWVTDDDLPALISTLGLPGDDAEGGTALGLARGDDHAPAADNQPDDATGRRARPKYRAWADLMRRAFEADVLACPKCGGRMIVLATIEDPAIQRILTHLGLSMEAGEALPAARASPWTDSPSE